MKAILLSIMAASLLLAGAGLARAAGDDEGGPCATRNFKTKLTEDACKAGGQKEAKKAWKAWQKQIETANADADVSCKSCHSKLAPDFTLKSDALDTFHKYGGK